MQDISEVSVCDIQFKKPVVYGSFFVRKVEGPRIHVTLPQCRVSEKTVKSARPSKIVVNQLLKLEEHVREIIGDRKFLNQMIVVNTVQNGSRIDHTIACQLNMYKTENLPINAFGCMEATLIGIKILGLFSCLLWRFHAFTIEEESPSTYCISDDPEEYDTVEIDQLTLIEIKKSLHDACNAAYELNEKSKQMIDRVKDLLSHEGIVPIDLENARSMLDDLV